MNIKNVLSIAVALVLSLMLNSCATIFSKGNRTITIDGDSKAPVTITTSKGVYENVTFPTDVEINRHAVSGQKIQVKSGNTEYKEIELGAKFRKRALWDFFITYGLPVDLATNNIVNPTQKSFYYKSPNDLYYKGKDNNLHQYNPTITDFSTERDNCVELRVYVGGHDHVGGMLTYSWKYLFAEAGGSGLAKDTDIKDEYTARFAAGGQYTYNITDRLYAQGRLGLGYMALGAKVKGLMDDYATEGDIYMTVQPRVGFRLSNRDKCRSSFFLGGDFNFMKFKFKEEYNFLYFNAGMQFEF